jgi:thymidylate synthase (FAD)
MTKILDQHPSVVLLGRPAFDVDRALSALRQENLEWRRTPGATEAEELIEFAGRMCYLSFGDKQSPRSNSAYIHRLIAQGHESVLEHAAWTFLLRGVTRAFTHQLVRHRVGFAFSQLSQQYADQSGARFRMPRALRQSERLQSLWLKTIDESQSVYREILSELEDQLEQADPAVAKEESRSVRSAARSVLPEATEAVIVFTANARALRHFLRTRGGIVGDEEMRLVAAAVLRLVHKEAPAVFADFSIVDVDGLPLVQSSD